MRSIMNPNRFQRSISPAHRGNPQPGRVFAKKMQRLVFNSRTKARRKVRFVKVFIPLSNPFWRHA